MALTKDFGRKVVATLLQMLPTFWRRQVYAKRLGFQPEEFSGLVFKIAETRAEFEQAFRLVHDISVERGIYPKKTSGMRVAPWHALPNTSVIIALEGNRVVGTLSLVEDSPLGLPMETVFPTEIERLRLQRRRLAEVSMLAVDKRFRGVGLTMMMNRFMVRWAYYHRNVTDLVIAVNPRVSDYYKSMMLFTNLGPSRPYESLRNTPVAPMRQDLTTWVERFQHTFGEDQRPGLQNLYRFFMLDRDRADVRLPARHKHLWVEDELERRPMSAEDFCYFFFNNEPVLEVLDETQRRFLRNEYSHSPGVQALLHRTTPARIGPKKHQPMRTLRLVTVT